MRLLVSHINFPGQFRRIVEYLGSRPGNEVVFGTESPRPEWVIPGVRKLVYERAGTSGKGVHEMARPFDAAVRLGAGLFRRCAELRAQGFRPDVILGHSGWGQTLFLPDLFPGVPYVGFFEWYYNPDGAESIFGGRVLSPPARARLRVRNAHMLLDLVACARGLTPTAWQREQFPPELRSKLEQIHDGIDTAFFKPLGEEPPPPAELNLPGVDLSGAEELVTFTARGLEPYRGFPQFYAALPALLEARPKCHVLIVAADRVCYSAKRTDGKSYKQAALEEVRVDPARVHFSDPVPYGQYVRVLQHSTVHVYLTWPFVLSWSFLEAMSCGCLLVASDTAPVREYLDPGVNGLATDFRDSGRIAASIVEALERRDELRPLRAAARRTVLERADLRRCLPRQLAVLEQAVARARDAARP